MYLLDFLCTSEFLIFTCFLMLLLLFYSSLFILWMQYSCDWLEEFLLEFKFSVKFLLPLFPLWLILLLFILVLLNFVRYFLNIWWSLVIYSYLWRTSMIDFGDSYWLPFSFLRSVFLKELSSKRDYWLRVLREFVLRANVSQIGLGPKIYFEAQVLWDFFPFGCFSFLSPDSPPPPPKYVDARSNVRFSLTYSSFVPSTHAECPSQPIWILSPGSSSLYRK